VSQPLRLFEAVGVELEYMLVHRDTMAVFPVADEVMRAVAGDYVADLERGPITWSNELVLHVIEFKTTEPAPTLDGLADSFQENVRAVNALLAPMGGHMLSTAVHPAMDPHIEARLWPHDYSPVYEAFDRVFDCRGHGWSNLQSLHINLPFSGDDEFGRLHAAIRLLLPMLPALAASSPIVGGTPTPYHDFRLEAYRHNSARIPSVAGRIIPEPVFTRAQYEEQILRKMYRDIAPHDPDGILQHEWLNARGAIARFDRDSIEIRVLDMQEAPAADVAIVAVVVETLRALVHERWSTYAQHQGWAGEPLEKLFLAAVATSDQTVVTDEAYLRMFGWAGGPCTANALWRHLYESLAADLPDPLRAAMAPIEHILDHGSLARRLLGALDRGDLLEQVFRRLADDLGKGRLFDGRA
jgi:glutamate---cysteine ligase / carboxylate-amine ligase